MRILTCILSILLFVTTAFSADKVLMMATTTSTDNTGLLDYLKPIFEKETNIEWRWVATGTGKALKLGENCDVDILLVHAVDAEKKFVADGYGLYRKEVMYNDFVIVGPKDDPAKIKGKSVTDALKVIYNNGAGFVSRGDESGTHQMEKELWGKAGITDYNKKAWYKETGQGMITTLNIAAEMNSYTLTDRGTYIKYEANFNGNPPLVIVVEGDKNLFNQYSLIPVSNKHCPNAKLDLAEAFTNWMISEDVQKLIADYKILGKQLFTPNAK